MISEFTNEFDQTESKLRNEGPKVQNFLFLVFCSHSPPLALNPQRVHAPFYTPSSVFTPEADFDKVRHARQTIQLKC